MKKKLLIFFLICCWAVQGIAQTKTISGKITAAEDGYPFIHTR